MEDGFGKPSSAVLSAEKVHEMDVETLQRDTRNACKSLLVKVGSNVLTKSNGGLDTTVLKNLARDIVRLRRSNMRVILVSSGAVAAGRGKLGPLENFGETRGKQILAASGQAELMAQYAKFFGRGKVPIFQHLLTKFDFRNEEAVEDLRQILLSELILGVPIVNENDTTAVEELIASDNDKLATLLAIMMEVDQAVFLTDVNGIHDKCPKKNGDATHIQVVQPDHRLQELIDLSEKPFGGTGGMQSKAEACKNLSHFGIEAIISNGRLKSPISDAVNEQKPVGTIFRAGQNNSTEDYSFGGPEVAEYLRRKKGRY